MNLSACVFQNDSLWALFREHPRLGYDITWLSAHEEGHVDDNLLTAGRRNATERVAMLLMHLYRRLDRIGLVEEGSVAFPLNQQHIADALGLSLVHTNKTLRRLAQLGLHELKNGRLRLLNTRALARIGHVDAWVGRSTSVRPSRKPSRHVDQVGRQPSSRLAFSFDAPLAWVIHRTVTSPAASRPSQAGTRSGGFAPTA